MATVLETSSNPHARARVPGSCGTMRWKATLLFPLSLSCKLFPVHDYRTRSRTSMRPRSIFIHLSSLPPSFFLYEGRMGGDAPAECVFPAARFTVPEKKETRAAPLRRSRIRSVLWHCVPARYFLNGPRGSDWKQRVACACVTDLDFKADPEMNHSTLVGVLVSSVFWPRGY